MYVRICFVLHGSFHLSQITRIQTGWNTAPSVIVKINSTSLNNKAITNHCLSLPWKRPWQKRKKVKIWSGDNSSRSLISTRWWTILPSSTMNVRSRWIISCLIRGGVRNWQSMIPPNAVSFEYVKRSLVS